MYNPIPWRRAWLRMTPLQFEKRVVEFLRREGQDLSSFEITHQAVVEGPDGEFTMDAVATFEALGLSFTVLVECKHHRRKVERSLVQVLADKVSSTRSQKGVLFSTGGFQDGAVEYASSRGIGLVHFTQGSAAYETRAQGGPVGPFREFDAWTVTWSEHGTPTYTGP